MRYLEKSFMRWPIHLQLLIPILSIVVIAVIAASMAVGYFGAVDLQRQQEEDLRRMVETVTGASYPLTDSVLRQMKGLTGCDFVLFDASGKVRTSTIELSKSMEGVLSNYPIASQWTASSETPPILQGEKEYVGRRFRLTGHTSNESENNLFVLHPTEDKKAALREALKRGALGGFPAAAIAVVFTILLAHRFVRPIRELCRSTVSIAEGHFSPTPVPRHNDEVRDLTLAINVMTEKLSRYEQDVRKKERLQTLIQLGAGLAHQIRNAATGAWMAVDLHRDACPLPENEESLAVALRQLKLIESYLQRFMSLGVERGGGLQAVPLTATINETLDLFRPACIHNKIELSFRHRDGEIFVWGNREDLGELCMNLALNALDAAKRPGESSPRVEFVLNLLENDRVAMEVLDTGPGPAASVGERLFEPFVTEKPEGTGLGLYVVQKIVESHDGTIRFDRVENKTRFRVELPVYREESHGAPVNR